MRTTRLVTGLGGLVVMAMLALVPARAQTGKAEIQWLGQAATKITTPGGKVIVIDPWLTTNPKTPAQYKNLDALGKVDLILGTHARGEPVGFIVQLENGFKVYHMGDTGLFGDMRLIGEYYKPDLLLIPIGGHFVMSPQDAAVATRDFIKPKVAIPIHYGTIPQLKGTPEEYIQALGPTSVKVHVMQPGDKLMF